MVASALIVSRRVGSGRVFNILEPADLPGRTSLLVFLRAILVLLPNQVQVLFSAGFVTDAHSFFGQTRIVTLNFRMLLKHMPTILGHHIAPAWTQSHVIIFEVVFRWGLVVFLDKLLALFEDE